MGFGDAPRERTFSREGAGVSPRGSKEAMAAPCPAGRQGPPCPPMSGSSHLSSAWPPAPGDPHAHLQGHSSTTGAWGAQAARQLKGFWPAHRVAGIHVALRQVRDVNAFLCTPVTAGLGLANPAPGACLWEGPSYPCTAGCKGCGAELWELGVPHVGDSPGSERRLRHILAMFILIYKRICIYN